MDIHKPKAWRGLREFLKEYLIIVVGVLTALAAEQGVEWLHWRHKVALSQEAMNKELASDLSYAFEQQAMNGCANRYIDRLQQAVAANRPDIIAALYRMGPPLDTHAWRVDTWTAALSAEVPDHLSPENLGRYSLVFRFVVAERDAQWELTNLYSDSFIGRFGRLQDPGATNDQLKAADHLRAAEARRSDITQGLLKASQALGVTPSQDRAAEFRRRIQACDEGLKATAAL